VPTPAAEPAPRDAGAEAGTSAKPCGPLRWIPQHCYVPDKAVETSSGEEYVEPDDWFAAHGARKADIEAQGRILMLGAMCRPLAVGPKAEEALFCMLHTKVVAETAYRAVRRARVIVVRKGAVAILLDVPFAFESFDVVGPPEPGEEVAIFGLEIDVRNASSKIVLLEPSPGACGVAAKTSADEVAAGLREKPVNPDIDLLRLDARLARQICAAAKTYAWTKGGFKQAP
jgi:hypothetical protein